MTATPGVPAHQVAAFLGMVAFFALAPFVVYPVFLMKALCFALFACAFNLLIGYVGLLSFGHATFLGAAGYATAHAAKVWGLAPELAIVFGTAVAGGLGVVIGGMGSIMGSIVTGFTLGLVEGFTKVFYPEASNTVIFVIMALVLMVRPAGLFGRTA